MSVIQQLQSLGKSLGGNLATDEFARRLYATDASEYQELPLAVVTPADASEVGRLVASAYSIGVGLIPRGAGTSLAGQVVGNGIVVDFSRKMNRLISVDPIARLASVEPGMVRNELNLLLREHKLFFAPETSTANRATIGGMVGNNSCGANSIVYGSTREHLVSVRGFFADGTEAIAGPLSVEEFRRKCDGSAGMERDVYRAVRNILGSSTNRHAITQNFPKSSVTRRNTGYALDRLMDCRVFDPGSDRPFNLCQLLAGSEGTLFVGVEYQLSLEPLPPPSGLLCAHFESVADALHATLIAMRHRPHGCELIDKQILDCTKYNLEQSRNRFFVEGDPGAVLVVDMRHHDRSAMELAFSAIEAECRSAGLGYAFPVFWGRDVDRVWELRRAGQGLMSNVTGNKKPREVVEDTAVAVEDLPAYIAEFDELLRARYDISCVYYAHAGAGELHTRPLFDLKTEGGLKLFRSIATDVATLVKKYRGSLSGEHGDGRLRGEFIPFMVGAECYELMRALKSAFDPTGILNPGKIIDTPPMDSALRYGPGQPQAEPLTVLSFDNLGGILGAAEQCNGVGECRKSARMGGTMCPSFMASGDERDTTRARANIVRHALANPKDVNPWNSSEVREVMDRCLSCKGCKSECPSSVDVAKLKAEWQHHWHEKHGIPLRTRRIVSFGGLMRRLQPVAPIFNLVNRTPGVAHLIRRSMGFAARRTMPTLSRTSLRSWHNRHGNPIDLNYPLGRVHLFCDEFSDTVDVHVGMAAIQLLNRLGWKVILPLHVDSGRAAISKGLLDEARELANNNVSLLHDVVSRDEPLIGLEPSAILGFRDEYPDLVDSSLRSAAKALAQRCFLLEEFLVFQMAEGVVTADSFDGASRRLVVHGHCHQKALSSMDQLVACLALPTGHQVETIPSGCCGMAGSFGYEAEHFELSMQVGELVLLPGVRAASPDAVIVAPGTSCRHQILDGTGRKALHPAEVLWMACD